MSSPRLNIVIACGGILASVCCILYSMDYFFDESPALADVICQIRPALLAASFSLIYGPMIGKTWRVNQIFRLAGAKRVVIKDQRLLLMTAVLLALDTLVILLWHFLDPVKFARFRLDQKVFNEVDQVLTIDDVTVVRVCYSQWYLLWAGALILYKFPFLCFGMREAWWTRGLILPTINDSMCVTVSCLVTVALATLYSFLSVALRKWPTAICACAVVALWISVMFAICFVFFPKLILWRRTPKGRVTRVSISSTSSSMAVLQSFEHLEAELNNANTEIKTLRDFIRQKEIDTEKLQDLLTNAENSLAQINLVQDLASSTGLDSDDLNQSLNSDSPETSCGVTSCCLHGNRQTALNEVFIPGEKGYLPAYVIRPEHRYHQPMKRRRRGKSDNISGYHHKHAGLGGDQISHRQCGRGSVDGGNGDDGDYRLHPEHRYHERLQPPSSSQQHREIDHYHRKGSVEINYNNKVDNNNKLASHCQNYPNNNNNKVSYDDDDDDLDDDDDDERLRKYYARVRKRRRSSTPSVHSVASLSKLSRLRADLSDAMAISKQLRSGWSTDAEIDSDHSSERRNTKDRQRRKTAIGIREITDSILESYDFQRTSDNQSFVSECITPRSSEASYEMKKKNKNTMKSSPYNNIRKIRQRRRQNNEKIMTVSYTKNSNVYTGISDRSEAVSHIDNTGNNTLKKPGEDNSCISHRLEDMSGRISPAAFYVTEPDAGRITFIPAQNVSILSLRNQALIGQTPGLAVITNDTLYPRPADGLAESRSKSDHDTRPESQVCVSVNNGGKTIWQDGGRARENSGQTVTSTSGRTRFPRSHSDNEIARRHRIATQSSWEEEDEGGFTSENRTRSAFYQQTADKRAHKGSNSPPASRLTEPHSDGDSLNNSSNSRLQVPSSTCLKRPSTSSSKAHKNNGGILAKSSSGQTKTSPEQRRVMFDVPTDLHHQRPDREIQQTGSKISPPGNPNNRQDSGIATPSLILERGHLENRQSIPRTGLSVVLNSDEQCGANSEVYQICTSQGPRFVKGFVLGELGQRDASPAGSGHAHDDSFA